MSEVRQLIIFLLLVYIAIVVTGISVHSVTPTFRSASITETGGAK